MIVDTDTSRVAALWADVVNLSSRVSVLEALRPVADDVVTVSVIIPTHNSSAYLEETMRSIELQHLPHPNVRLEVSIYDDGSTDDTFALCERIRVGWTAGRFVLSGSPECRGAGYARTAAVRQCHGDFLMFNDSDDVSHPLRLKYQIETWRSRGMDETLVGSYFSRDPPDATRHYADFLNSLSPRDLVLKSFREITMIQPTWFMSRRLLDRVGGYPEGVLAEDLEVFHRCLDVPGMALLPSATLSLPLVMYRHRPGSNVTSKTPRRVLLRAKLRALERRVLSKWGKFSVWGAGRDGHAFFQEMAPEYRSNVRQFADVDPCKIRTGFHDSGFIIPVVHVSQITAPFVVCVAMGRTNGELEANVSSHTNLTEGVDYWYFN